MTVVVPQIIELIKQADIIGVEADDLVITDSLASQGIDSLEVMAILLNVEEEFDIKIPDEDIEQLTSVEEIVAYVNHRLAA